MKINFDQFSTVAFIDSNVALECLALEQLPWHDIDPIGPILVLVAPTVLKEVDSKKNDARLGDHARRFNRTLLPLLGDMATVVIRKAPNPVVEIGLAICSAIDWGKHPELNSGESDSKIVAETLAANGPDRQKLVLISQDIRPLHLAKQNHLKTHPIQQGWLRPKEISKSDKRIAVLEREIEAMRKREPMLKLSLSASKSSVAVHRFVDLSPLERGAIQNQILRLNPLSVEKQDSSVHQILLSDHLLPARYKRWSEVIVPKFVGEFERKMELNFGQVEILFRIENIGQVPADTLLIQLTVQGGWINDRYVLASPAGPAAPAARSQLERLQPNFRNHINLSSAKPGTHEFVVNAAPKRSKRTQIECSDFRHGHNYEYRMIGWVDPFAEKFLVDVVVTSSNLYGRVDESLVVAKTVTESSVLELVDPDTLKFRQQSEMVTLLHTLVTGGKFHAFEFDGADWDN